MKLTIQRWSSAASWLVACAVWTLTSVAGTAQGVTTTTVQGTVYLANGQPGSGTLQLSWPAFTTASNQAVTAGRINVVIGPDGYLSVNLAPNQGSTPAGLYYTAIYHLSDGTTSTEYWTVPSAAQASLAQIRAQVMPAAQAVQAVSKSYVDQSIAELTQSLLTASGGSLSGPLFLNGDPTQPKEAATKHYVDDEFGMAVPLTGAALSGPLTSIQLGAAYQADQFPGADFGAKLQACVNKLDAAYGGTCDARNFSGAQAISSPVVIATANATVQLPCATITTASPIEVTAGTRNVTLHGCALRGASHTSGSQGGTVFLYSGSGPVIQVGDSTYGTDTPGFHMDNAVINTTASTNAGAVGLVTYRTQEIDLESIYLLGNSNQTGMTLDGTGNYTGGTFQDIELSGFGIGLNAIGHQVTNTAITDWLNASTFIRLHIDCPTSAGSPVAGTYGINLLQGDGNTFTGGDVEGCATALHLGLNAQNNTIIGLRNENSINQVVADAGSSYNSWITGGTMFTGQLTDKGTRNSFLDTFHRSFNSLNGDWYGSQQDATVTNHFRIGTGVGNERGLLNRYQSDYGYRWTTGLSDATAGEQFYQVLDELNNVYRLSIGQYNNGQPSTNNQTVINAAGTGAVVLNGSTNSGTGGVVFGAGGTSGATVATINNAGNAQFNGTLQVSGPSTFTSTTTVKNQADGEIDSVLWAGSTANQKESFIFKDYSGASQWYMVKDASNNWALNSATGGLDSFKAYQSNNSGDTYINASNGTGHIRLNYESGSGNETDIYSGSSSGLIAAFLGSTAIKFPGLAASSGRNCLQIDNSGYISNTGAACGTGSGGVNGTVNAGSAGQVAFYAGNGTVLSGVTSVAVNAGGTGGTTAEQALQNLGAQPAMPGVASDGASGVTIGGSVATGGEVTALTPVANITHTSYGAKGDDAHDDAIPIRAASAAVAAAGGGTVYIPAGIYRMKTADSLHTNSVVTASANGLHYVCAPGAVIDMQDFNPSSAPALFHLDLSPVVFTGNYHAFNAVPAAGATSITMVTPSDATTYYQVGDDIYLLGGPSTESGYDGDWVKVISTNGSTGVVGLDRPTTKPYMGYAGLSSGLPLGTIAALQLMDHSTTPATPRYMTDLSVEGCTVRNMPRDFVYVDGAVRGLKLRNNTVYVNPANNVGGLFLNPANQLDQAELAGNYFETGATGAAAFTQLAWGNQNIDIHDNTLISTSGQTLINPSEGATNVHIHHNHMFFTAPAGTNPYRAAINIATAYKVTLDHNDITANIQSTSQTTAAINLSGNPGSCQGCVVDTNVITCNALGNSAGLVWPTGINFYDSNGGTSIINNRIENIGCAGGISVMPVSSASNATIAGNTIHIVSGGSGIAFLHYGTGFAASHSVVGNTIYGDSGANVGTGIYWAGADNIGTLADNSMFNLATGISLVSSGAPLMTNNTCLSVTTTTNCGTPGLAFTNLSNTFVAGTTQDFHLADHTLPSKTGTVAARPSTCSLGEEYFATDATPGQNEYFCTAPNTWTQMIGGPTVNWGFSAPQYSTTTGWTASTAILGNYFKTVDTVNVNYLCYYVRTADNTANLYDIGVRSANGNTLVVHLGASAGTTAVPSTGFRCTAVTGGPVALTPGTYIAELTTNCTSSCAAFGGPYANSVWYGMPSTYGAATGGTLPSTVSLSSSTYGAVTSGFWLGWHN